MRILPTAIPRSLLVTLGVWLLLGEPGSAAAQPAQAEDPVAAEARRRFQAGVALFQEGNPQGALLEFRESMRLRPVAVVQFNIAQALKLLLRYEEAIAAYELYLQMGGDEITPERRQDVQVTIARLRLSISHLDVACGPDGAEIRVDGQSVAHLPIASPLPVAAGRHEVELRMPGRTASRDIEVAAGVTLRVCLSLVPEAAAAGATPPRTEGGILGKWWFWALTGAVLAGGVTAAVLLSAPEGGDGLHRGNVDPDLVTAAW